MIYLPYSPDFSPIEQASQEWMKAWIRKIEIMFWESSVAIQLAIHTRCYGHLYLSQWLLITVQRFWLHCIITIWHFLHNIAVGSPYHPVSRASSLSSCGTRLDWFPRWMDQSHLQVSQARGKSLCQNPLHSQRIQYPCQPKHLHTEESWVSGIWHEALWGHQRLSRIQNLCHCQKSMRSCVWCHGRDSQTG